MIQLESISKSFGADVLFENLTWQLPLKGTIGLVGPNGAGKTTLFRIISGEEEPDSGKITSPRDLRVGYLPQELTPDQEGTLLEVILEGRRDLLEMEVRIAEMEAAFSQVTGDEQLELSEEYGTLQDVFRRNGGYVFQSRAREIAVGIGFSPLEFDRPIAEFSGGWQMRALLCRLLLSQPDILLLDEPTNHLDLESLEWIESFLDSYEGTIVLISHDRYFLNRLVDGIAELDRGDIHLYPGNYDFYVKARAEQRELLLQQAAQQQKTIAKTERFIERFRYKATKSNQVQSRVKQLDKVDRIDVPLEQTSRIQFKFPQPPRMGKIVLDARGVTKAYGENVIYDGLDFQLQRGDKVALVGPNGAGKTTLLKMLAGVLPPDAGEVEVGHRVEVTYFAQHALDSLDASRTALEEMMASASFDATPRVRSILGAFLFQGDDVDKPITVLSGGEKSRLALAKMLLEPGGCLLLDEPTNHLDIASRQVLEHALKEFQGAIVIISHDRYFLNEVVNKVLHVEHGALTDYVGDYDYYRWKRNQEKVSAPEADGRGAEEGADDDQPVVNKKDQRRLAAELRKRKQDETRALRKEFERVEASIASLEARHEELQAALAAPDTYENGDAIGELNREYQEISQELEALIVKWEEKGAELEEIDARYAAEEATFREG
ncbi:MAG: ABC-F family ATP-binding cassette domain-containing protein [Bradymonadaceae bacterium]